MHRRPRWTLIVWKSKVQKHVTHSSGESEYVTLSEATKDIKFITMLLESMGIKVNLWITVRVDNVVTIFMAKTAKASSCTRHIDVKYHHI